MQYVRIPEERVSVLIGAGGSVKRKIEKKTNCKLGIEDNEVSIEGESLGEWIAKDIVHAVGRGFNPYKALILVEDGYVLDFLDLKEYANTPKSVERLKGRVIGEEGRTRKHLERSTGAMVCVYGKTVAFIGTVNDVALAKTACDMLLSGKRHSTVYRFLDKQARASR